MRITGLTFFIRLWIWFGFRQLRARLWRTLAVLVGIGLGAAVFTSVRLAVDASLDSFTRSVDALSGKSDYTVLCPGGRVPESLIAGLIRHPAVQAVSPLSTTYVQIGEEASEPFLLIGLDPILDRSLRTWQATPPASQASPSQQLPDIRHPTSDIRNAPSPWLDLMAGPFTLIAGEQLCNSLHLQDRPDVPLVHPHGRKVFRVLGRLAGEGPALVEGGKLAVTDIATFQEFTGTHGSVDRLDILLKPAAASDGAAQIRASLPPGVTLEQPSDFKESGRLMVRSYQLNLSVLSFVSLFVGMFLIYSLISLHAISRRKELAVLRSLGASPRLVFLLFLAEGAFFGCFGWLLAIPLGSFMVKHLLGHVSSTISTLFVRVEVNQLVLDPAEVLLSLLTTLLVSLLAAWQPAHEAMQVAPREVLLAQDYPLRPANAVKRLACCGIALVVLVWPLGCLPALDGVPLSGYVATFFLFAGFSLVSPWVLQRLGNLLPPLLRRVAGEPAYLGGRHIRDAGTRIAISVGALITATALFVALVIMVHSFKKTVELWLTQTISGDLYLRPKLASVNQYRDTLAPEIVNTVKSFSRKAVILPYRRIYLHYDMVPYQFEATDFKGFMKYAQFLFIAGKLQHMMPLIEAGRGVIVSEVFANQTGVGVGKRFQAQIGTARLDVPVLGIFRDYRSQGGAVYYSMRHFQELSGDTSWSGVRFNFTDPHPGGDEAANALRAELFAALGHFQAGVELTLGHDLRQMILRIFDETFAITTVLLLIALAVATLGITSTLTVLVLDRTRQFLTILACGGARGQVRLMILWEALLMVFTGEMLGLACGFALSYLLIFVINRQSFGWTFLYTVDWPALALALPLILGTALLSALPSGQLIFRTAPARVLREG